MGFAATADDYPVDTAESDAQVESDVRSALGIGGELTLSMASTGVRA